MIGRGIMRWLVAWTAALNLTGCAAGADPWITPPPVAPPDMRVVAPVVGMEATVPELVPPPPESMVNDEILSSPMTRDAEFQERVAFWVEHWTTTASGWFPDYLERMARFVPGVDSALARGELPPSLRYLPVIESGYSPRAVSTASAAGLWQFMAPTARGFGMEVTPLLDERRNPMKSTEAAVDFLQSLRERFGSWYLALAAYNSGPGRVRRMLDRYAPMVPASDSLYWALRHRLPRETRDFVPKLLAAAQVASNPRVYGYDVPADTLGFLFDTVTVPDASTLDVVALAAEAPQDEIERLNPEIVRGITPPGRITPLRVPLGSGAVFRENYERIPASDRVTFVEHRVASGETLSHIALRYRIPLRDLEAANPGVDARLLQIGQRLTVPIAPSRGRSSR
jgi:membrane-bound lytic murein transglycosylase D